MSVNDDELRRVLEATLGPPVRLLSHRPWPYASSAPLEQVVLAGHPPILCKHQRVSQRRPRPAFLIDPLREVEAYTDVLRGLDTPRCYGAGVEDDRVWLFLEVVDGPPLWQVDGMEAWETAARWLARLHRMESPPGSRLIRYNTAYFERWIKRASAMSPAAASKRVQASARLAVQRLAEWPATLIHGEFYPSNILVQATGSNRIGAKRKARIRAVDWETVGVGPGLLDLAALTAGDWSATDRDRIVASYRSALDGVEGSFEQTLDAARLLVALQWLGWQRDWSPPPEHRHDWASDALELAGRIVA